MYINSWVNKELSQVSIRDSRLVNRLVKTVERLSEHPHLSIPQACGDWKTTKATYRLIDNNKLTPEGITMSHSLQTIERMKKSDETILILQDTMHADYTNHPSIQGLGLHTNYLRAKGLLLHSALAVTESGVPLGLLHQEFWTRPPKDHNRDHDLLPIEEKESNKWLKALESSTKDIPDNIRSVTVCDREADIYHFFNKAVSEGKHLLIRAKKADRSIVEKSGDLKREIEKGQLAGEVIIKIPRNANINSPEREARLGIKYCPITMKPPRGKKGSWALPNLKLYAVLAKELSTPPKGIQPIYWILLTTIPVSSVEEALEKIQWYTQRWKIERFHLTLKSGCKIEERQFDSYERLINAIAIYSIIAWRILWLTYESRENPSTSCEVIFKTYEWQAIYCFVNKTKKLPANIPTLKEILILVAKLGGFLGRRCDKEPGVIAIWRGMSRLNDIAQSWLIFNCQSYSNDVGNA